MRFPSVAVAVIAVIYVVGDLSVVEGTTRAVMRAAVILAALVVAGIFYQRWGSVSHRTAPHHAMAALSLLGGALIASSALGAGGGVFSNDVTALLGLGALFLSLAAARASVSEDASGVNR